MRARTKHYSDTVEVRQSHTGLQRGPTTDTVLSSIWHTTDAEKREAGLFAASTAIRQGWTPEEMPCELSDVVSMLGLK